MQNAIAIPTSTTRASGAALTSGGAFARPLGDAEREILALSSRTISSGARAGEKIAAFDELRAALSQARLEAELGPGRGEPPAWLDEASSMAERMFELDACGIEWTSEARALDALLRDRFERRFAGSA